MISLGLPPDDRLLVLARATVRPMPKRLLKLPMGELCRQAREWEQSDPPERMAGLIQEAVGLVKAGANPLLQWPAIWEAARTDWLQVVLAAVVEQEEDGHPLRNKNGETVLHWLAQEAALFDGFARQSWPRQWISLPDARGDLPLHAVWHPVHGIQGRIEQILRGPKKDQWNAYERLDEAIETTEALLAGGAGWEQLNQHGETGADRLLAAHDAGVFNWLPNNASVAWIEPVVAAKVQERRYKTLDLALPEAESGTKPRF